ncbi:MAG TPA: amidohydrolase, partial [Afipia sp.]|nr:amidohydrolase [Afipia sp.]
MPTRRTFIGAASGLVLPGLSSAFAADDPTSKGATRVSADLVLHHGLFTTLDRTNPTASAVAIKDGKFLAVGGDQEVMAHAGPDTRVIDLKGRRVLPGLIDNHLHIIRGGLNFNMELRWDGVRSLADAMNMLKRQVAITPPPQWA